MDPFDWAQTIVERCERAEATPTLMATFQRAIEDMGFRHFAFCSHFDCNIPPHRTVVVHNYPVAWAEDYIARNLFQMDPVLQQAERTLLPFRWNTAEFNAGLTSPQKRMLEEAAGVGIVNGYTVPIHLPRTSRMLQGSCSVVPDSDCIDERAYRAVHIMAIYLYASEQRQGIKGAQDSEPSSLPVLSMRERQCLELAAQGKSDWEISQLLGISESTVHKHVESAKRRLGVSTRIQAVVWAVQHREICFGDVAQSRRAERTGTSTTH